MATPLTQDHFDHVLEGFRQSMATKTDLASVEEGLASRIEGQRAEMKEDVRDVTRHLSKVTAAQNDRFDRIDAKLDAVMEMLATRKELHNLVRALKRQGIKLEEADIFAG